jgi:FtsP/CotA-like multicopper oxidase with cupredoxin domain
MQNQRIGRWAWVLVSTAVLPFLSGDVQAGAGFLYSEWCHAGLPHKKSADDAVRKVQSERVTQVVEPGHRNLTGAETSELRSLPVLDADFSGCMPRAPGTVRSMQLTARTTVRSDVGPYSVTLPGYARANSPAAQDSYAPFVIESCRGDELSIDLENGTGQPINFHTHGMIVRPTPNVPGPPGDYIYMQIDPGQQVNYKIDIPPRLPGNLLGRYPTPQPYPTGLYWFHDHMHGIAADAVMGGQAGLLSVGNPLSLEHSNPDGSVVAQPFPPETEVRYLALRDVQLRVPNCPAGASDCQPGQPMFPDKVTHPPYAHGVTWFTGDGYDSGLCASPQTVRGPGFCGVADGPGASKVWLFTINGQAFPQITLPTGHNQLWRIGNLSASTTYVLELRDDATGSLQSMHVVAFDGIIAGTPMPNDPHNLVGVHLRRLLLMPASRAEVFISSQDFVASGNGKPEDLTLQTSGIMTGAPNVGDPWPAVQLARVHVEAAPPGGKASQPLAVSVARYTPALTTPPAASPSRSAAGTAPPEGCILLPAGDRRVITFAENNATNTFMLGSEVVDANDKPVPDTLIPPTPFHMGTGPDMAMTWDNAMAGLPGHKHVCPVLGTVEVWELVNTTDEMHNFHIHQARFRLADSHDEGAPRDLVIGQTANCQAEPRKSVCAPDHIIGSVVPEFESAVPVGNVDIWHDVFPVPPRALDPKTKQYTNGRVFVAIPFLTPEQVGRFVFHCHIMEHEDGGMMAPMEVLSAGG